jgi:hypothetical protein
MKQRKIIPKPYEPLRWQLLPNEFRQTCESLSCELHKAVISPQPTYDTISQVRVSCEYPLREEIRVIVENRNKNRFSMIGESVRFRDFSHDVVPEKISLYDLAKEIRKSVIGEELPRDFSMTFVHNRNIRIPPPSEGSAIFSSLESLDGPPLYKAMCSYVIICAAHPFSDGNGRVARFIFNFLISRYWKGAHFIPLAELIHQTSGVFEEIFAKCDESGDYLPILIFLMRILKSYAHIIEVSTSSAAEELIACRQAADKLGEKTDLPIVSDNRPPYVLSLSKLFRLNENLMNVEFLNEIRKAVLLIKDYGTICFIITRLDYFDPKSTELSKVSFFLQTENKEKLLKDARELKRNFGSMIVQFVPVLENQVLNAKLLLNVSDLYKGVVWHRQCPVILCEVDH